MNLALGRYGAAVDECVGQLTAAGAPGRVWQRDVSFWGGDAARKASVANRLGWLDVASLKRQRIGDIVGFAEEVRSAGHDDAVLLGMGGSSLAPEVLRRTFGRRDGWPTLHVLDTTDPAAISAVERQIDPARTLFFVSSKSGTTLEPLSLFRYFHERVRAAKHDRAGENFVGITDAGTPLQDLAREHGFRHVFTNPGDIGGRYSALTYFGLVPSAVAGVDVRQLLDRGIAAAQDARLPQCDALVLGAALGALAARGRDKTTFITAPAIASFGLWVEQLLAESTGKLGRGVVPVVGEPLGSPDAYGDDRVFIALRMRAEPADDRAATVDALRAAGHPVITIELDDAFDLGREFVRWEFAVAIIGHVLDINPFDEPNVQESKDNTNRVLEDFAATGVLDVQDIDADNGIVIVPAPDQPAGRSLAQAVKHLLDGIAGGDYFAITAYIQQTDASDDSCETMRRAVQRSRHCATTLGYGPRFLHSTGQLHKGGPPHGLFLQITQRDPDDIAIPGVPYSFGQFKRAQAIGDFEALIRHKRPVLRVHLAGNVDDGLAELRRAVEDATRARAGGE
ncbi:MAG TPA: glucose-6-phosphate isomerase [Dehalococcoidia bacterium]|nr:glucose-6-phosphate isomerase [Dehalococcoidia bacterium]